MGHKYGIGDVVYSTIWNEDVRITKLNDNLFYTVRSINRYDWMMTHEGNLKSREDVIEKMMQEHQDVCNETLTIQGIDTSEFEMIEGLVEEETKPIDMGEVSDGYHTFNELYEYRMLYNAALFNEFAKQGLYDVHKSRKHSDGEYPFGDSNWFIVMAELPTGQISNHYEMKDWDKFQIPEKPLANKWDEHSPRDVANRLTSFTTPKKEVIYPKTYEECLSVLGIYNGLPDVEIYNAKPSECELFESLIRLKRCRDAYWKLYGEEMGLGKPWEPDWKNSEEKRYSIVNIEGDINLPEKTLTKWILKVTNKILVFPTEEMRDAFYENFKKEIEMCKELL